MTIFDFVVIGVMLVSVALGLWRGLAHEAMSIIGLIAAYQLARMYAHPFGVWLPATSGPEHVRVIVAFVAIFVIVVFASDAVASLISKLMGTAGLGLVNRVLGGGFGIIRGGLLILIMVWLAGMTSLPQQSFWRDASFSRPLVNFALEQKGWLPDNLAQRLHY